MSEIDTSSIGKVFNQAMKTTKTPYVKESEFQIHTPIQGELSKSDGTPSFKNILGDYIQEVNTLQHDADSQIQRLVAGETDNLHEVMVAMNEAETSFEMMMEIRNKLVNAYQELQRMQG